MAQATIGALRVVLGADTAAFDKAMGGAAKSLARLGKKMQRAGATLSLAVTVPLVAAGVGVLKLASDAVESENLFTVAMGDMADSARAFSEDMSKALGVNAFETRKTIATFYQMTTAMGISRDAALSMSEGMAQLTGDVASFFNLRPEDAFTKLQSAISGEIEPMRRLGVSVSETTVKLTLMKAGLIEGNEKLTEQQKILGRYITILEQTSVAQGDLARTLDSPANQMRILKSRFEEIATELGVSLLPLLNRFMTQIAGPVVGAIQKLVTVFVGLSPRMQNIILGFAALAAAMGPLLFVFGGFFRVVSAVLIPLGSLAAAMIAGDMLSALSVFRSRWVLIAAAVLTAAASLAYFTGFWGKFKEKIEGLNIFKGLGDDVGEFNKLLSEEAVKAFKDLQDAAAKAGKSIAQLKDEGKRLFAETRTPAEALRIEFERLNELLKAKAISFETYARAIEKAQDAFDDFKESSNEALGQIKEMTDSVASGMTDAFADFAENGKLQFKDLARSIINDLTRIAIKQALMPVSNSVAQGLGALFSVPGFAHGGSILPGGAGGGIDSQLVTFRKSPQERVDIYTPGQGGGSGGGISVPVTVNIDARGADRDGMLLAVQKLKAEVPSIVVSTIRDQKSRRVL